MIIAINGRIGSGKDTVGDIIQYLTSSRVYDKTYEEWNTIKHDKEYLGGLYYKGYSTWKVKKFADKLKDIVCLLTGCTREQLEDQEFKNRELVEEWWYYKISKSIMLPRGYYPNEEDNKMCEQRYLCKPTYRTLLQQIGTDLFRNQLHPNVWVNSLMNEYKEVVKFDEYKGSTDPCSICGKSLREQTKGCNEITCYRGRQGRVELLPSWIITDMRFTNELKAVKDRGGITIRVTRNKFNISNIKEAKEYLGGFRDYKDRHGSDNMILSIANSLWIETQNFHESETALDDTIFDWEVDNNGSIEELIVKVRQILITEKII